MIRRSKKTQARNRIIKQLDDLARQAVFERDGHRCVRCESGRNLQWCHVFSRRDNHIRWETDNAFTGCAGCHLWWHREPALAIPWFMKNWPHRYERMLTMKNIGGKVDIKALLEHMRP